MTAAGAGAGRLRRIAFAATAVLLLGAAGGIRPDEMMADPAQEARARTLDKEFRCLVCRNQSIDDSDADLAHDLRRLVRERIRAGDSDAQVRAYLVSRYGDYVLLDPPFKPETWALWLATPAVGALGAWLAFAALRRRRRAAPPAPLDPAEAARLKRLLEAGDGPGGIGPGGIAPGGDSRGGDSPGGDSPA